MKKLAITLLCLSPVIAIAQNPMGMNQQDMQKMMQQMHKAQACMEKIDQGRMQLLEQEATAFESKMRSLCAAGKRSEAQSQAIAFGQKMMNDIAVKQIQNCTKNMVDSMKGMMPPNVIDEMVDDYSKKHVCDEIKSR